jgi:hypothetical protein
VIDVSIRALSFFFKVGSKLFIAKQLFLLLDKIQEVWVLIAIGNLAQCEEADQQVDLEELLDGPKLVLRFCIRLGVQHEWFFFVTLDHLNNGI